MKIIELLLVIIVGLLAAVAFIDMIRKGREKAEQYRDRYNYPKK